MRRIGAASVLALLLALFLAGPASADPPGNNGTIKIEFVGAADNPPDNNPHVPCTFLLEFRGYDQGVGEATYSFALHPPSGTSTLTSGTVAIGEDAAGGATDLDAQQVVDLEPFLTGGTPHPIQGYHIKVTVHAPGSVGADTKYKVFWVECGGYPPSGTTTRTIAGSATAADEPARPDWAMIGLAVLVIGLPTYLAMRKIRGAAPIADE
jgi:hypothetical protein